MNRTSSIARAALALAILPVAAAAQAIPAMHATQSAGEDAVATYFTQDSVGDVQLGDLGVQKSQNPAVRSLAQTLVRDHTKTAQAGLRVAQAIGDSDIKFKPGDDNVIILVRLQRYSGAQFDREYVKAIVDAHKVDIQTAQDSLDFVQNASLRSYLQQTLSVDKRHLQMAEQAQTHV